MRIITIEGNIFNLKNKYSLVHCIAADAIMGKGIALQFRNFYPEMQLYIRNNKPSVPDCISYTANSGRTIYNLVTKESSYGKPTRDSLTKSLILLKQAIVKNGDKYIAMPLIGAGLDRLSWNETEKTIKELFNDVDVNIAVVKFVK
jgi:O-acetyl-ADP-ribose deacetylase (regulator of RNase III)